MQYANCKSIENYVRSKLKFIEYLFIEISDVCEFAFEII